jgi:nucleoside-diphosphate-sugar epimerase
MADAAVSVGSGPRVALVTGATGFVGSHLVSGLVRAGWQVHVVSRANSRMPEAAEFSRVTQHVHDGSTAGMLRLVGNAKPLVVFHLASLFLSQHEAGDVERLVLSNILFGNQLLEAMKVHGVKQLINTGTSWQHYENQAYSPVNLYAATKQAFESLMQYYVEAEGLRAVSLKLFDTYGPHDPRPKLMNLLQRVAEDMQPLAMSPGEQWLDLVHVDDVVQAFFAAAARLSAGAVHGHESYALPSGQPITLRALVRLVEREIGRELPILWGARPYRVREVMELWNGKSLPGWSAKVKLEQAIHDMFSGLKR